MHDPIVPDAEITLIARSLPAGILSTCWTVLAECYKLMCPKPEELGKERVRFVIDVRSFATIRDQGGVSDLVAQNSFQIYIRGMAAPFVASRGSERYRVGLGFFADESALLIVPLSHSCRDARATCTSASPEESLLSCARIPLPAVLQISAFKICSGIYRRGHAVFGRSSLVDDERNAMP
jgi:hypothetical protein